MKKTTAYGFAILMISILSHFSVNKFGLILAICLLLIGSVLKFFISLLINQKVYCLALSLCKLLSLTGEELKRKVFLLN